VVATRLKELRKEHNLTQNTISGLLNISREAYSMYENNKRQLNYESLCIISNFYHVSLDYLFGLSNTSESPEALSEDEHILLLQYRELDTRGQEIILGITKLEYERKSREAGSKSKTNHLPSIPV